jgi:hypothetical protein
MRKEIIITKKRLVKDTMLIMIPKKSKSSSSFNRFFLKNMNTKKTRRMANFVSKRAVSVPIQGSTCTTYYG